MTSTRLSPAFRLALVGAAIAIAAPAAATVELIANGGFENTGFGGTSGYYNIGQDHAVPADFGFAVPVNNVDIVANGVYGPTLATGGAYSLDLVGYGSTGAISQSITTVAGRRYTVSFDYSKNNGIAAPTADVSFDGATIGSVTGTNAWQTFTTTFIGTGAAATFAITETLGGGNAGVFLDNISVTVVPDAATWSMMIAGFAMVGVAARRRKRSLVA